MEGIVIFAVITFLVMGIQYAVKSHRKKAWLALGSELGLDFYEGGFFGWPRMTGEHLGVPVVIDVEVRGSGKHKRVYTRVSADVPAILPSGLAVSKEGLLSGVGKFFGSQDIEIGDDTFDAACMIKGEIPSEVIRLFQDRPARDAVWELVHQGSEGSLSAGRAKILLHGFSSNGAALRGHLDTVVGVARALSAAVGAPVPDIAADADWTPVPKAADVPAPAAPVPTSVPTPVVDALPPAPVVAPVADEPVEAEASPPSRADDLQRLADRGLSYGDKRRVIEGLQIAPLDVVLTVDKVERTSALGLDDAYRQGRTVIGTVGALSVGVRYPSDRNEGLEALAAGTQLPVSADFIDFDDFYRRAILQA